MFISDEELRYCLGRAKWMREQYKLYAHPDKSPPSVDEFLRICREEMDVKKINVLRVPLEGNSRSIRSAVTLSDNEVNIYVLEGQDERMNRYLIAKELFHILIDQE